MTLLTLQVASFLLAVSGKWRITSRDPSKRRLGFMLTLTGGLIFNSVLAYSGLYFSACAGCVLMAIDFRGVIHNARHQ